VTRWLSTEEHAAKRHTTVGAIKTERWRGKGPRAVSRRVTGSATTDRRIAHPARTTTASWQLDMPVKRG
jgi:hypothetical protein